MPQHTHLSPHGVWSNGITLDVADVLKQFQREYIQIFRYGDDEFAVIITNFESNDSLVNFIDCIYDAFRLRQISVSGGVSIFPVNTEKMGSFGFSKAVTCL